MRSDPFFRLPDSRQAVLLPPTEFVVGDCRAIPFRMKLAPPRAATDTARALTPATSMLWIPSRVAQPGDVVTAAGAVVMPDGDAAWVFFCDDMPGTYFSHPCRYFVIDANGGVVHTVDASAPPRARRDDPQYIEDRPSRRFLFT